MRQGIVIFLVALLWGTQAEASMRFRGRSIRDVVREANTVSTVSQQSGCPDAANTGEVHFTDLTESFDCDGDEGFTFTQTTNLVNINEATDGNSILLRLDNDQANAGGSTNETAQLRFGFGTDTDAARMIAGKFSDFTSASTSDGFLAFNVDADGTSTEIMRVVAESPSAPNPTLGLMIGTTTLLDAALNVVAFDTSSGKAIQVNYTTGEGLLRVGGSGIAGVVQIGDNSPTIATEVGIIGATNATLTIQASSNDTPVSLLLRDGTAAIGGQISLNNPSTQSTAYYLATSMDNVSSVQHESPLMIFNPSPSQTLTINSGSTLSNLRYVQMLAPTINGVAGGATETVTNATTVYINAAPSGSDITITNPYALWVDDGAVRLDGTLTVGSIDTGGGVALELAAGQWTPTTNNIANLDSSSAAEGQYLRVGATVTFSIRVNINPTLAATSTQLELDLPVTSNFGSTDDVAGSCFASGITGQGAALLADTASDEIEFRFISGDLTDQAMYCAGSYQII